MNKSELVDAVAQNVGNGASRKQVEETLNAFVETVGQTLKNGDKVSLVGFGTFEARKREARTGQNPQTGQKIQIKATTVPAFRPGQGLKDVVAGKKKPGGAGNSSAKKSAAKSSAAKKSAAKKSAAKKSAAKKASTKKAAPAKKSATKKASTKKAAPAKKSTAKKSAAKKSAAKKAASKKAAPAKKSTAKKSTAKKSTAKKAAKKR